MKVAIFFGTRPEVIKLSTLCKKMRENSRFQVSTVFTGQHSSLFDDVKHLIPNVDFHSYASYAGMPLPHTYCRIQEEMTYILEEIRPDMVIVQGDTSSAYAVAVSAFLMGIKVGHVEAGLRTWNINSPFPEEFNRQMISKIAYYNWCPSELAAENLKKENVDGKIIVTGNTIVDMINETFNLESISYNNRIIITLHRRENKELFSDMLNQINDVANNHPELNFLFPAHPNPIISQQLNVLTENNIKIVNPMKYEAFIYALRNCRGVISDSGGIQEEALCFRKKVLICRSNTERMEGVNIGACKLVGSKIKENFDWLLSIDKNDYKNPYGDGTACKKIIESIL